MSFVNKHMIIAWKTIAWLSMLLFSLCCFSQQTFSNRLPLISTTVFNSIQVLDNGTYLISGFTLDTVPQEHFDFATALFDEFGGPINYEHFGDPQHQTFTQHNAVSLLNNIYIQQGLAERNGINTGLLTLFDHDGDTIKEIKFYSPHLGQPWNNSDSVNPRYSILMQDSTIYCTSGIFGEETYNDVCIWHFDKDGNELWHYIYATEADPETCYAMVPWQGGVMAAIFKGINDSEYQSDLDLLNIQENGIDITLINESIWNNFSSTIQAVIIDNGYPICAGGIAEFPDQNSRPAIWKINTQGDLIWSAGIGEYPIESNNSYYFKTLIKTTDGNYVATYEHYSPGSENNSYHFNVRVLKMDSLDGSLLWNRTYSIVESQNDIHSAIDLKATPDGGVVFCGHASDAWSQNPNLELPVQQGWIVKLDACGCLVPGCDENCDVSVAENDKVANQSLFLVGPNPAQDFLNIYLKEISGIQYEDIVFEIFDLSGKLVKSFSPYRGDTTYLLDTNDINAGEYLLLLKKGNELLQCQKIVVMN